MSRPLPLPVAGPVTCLVLVVSLHRGAKMRVRMMGCRRALSAIISTESLAKKTLTHSSVRISPSIILLNSINSNIYSRKI